MKKLALAFAAFAMATLMLSGSGCEKEPKEIPSYGNENKDDDDDSQGGGTIGADKLSIPSDLVLIYGGGHHRNPYSWGYDRMRWYTSYADKDGKRHWLFDGFLLLEFMDPATDAGGGGMGSGKTFITGYKYNGEYMPSATKTEWQNLIDYYFATGTGIDAIEQAIATDAATIGQPKSKRKIVIGVPEPIKYLKAEAYTDYGTGGSDYWGSLDGKKMNFLNDTDRIAAVKWFVDQCSEAFNKKNYKYVELGGFYWVAEKTTHTSTILPKIATYIKSLNYTFNWIPYYTAEGWDKWKSWGFTNAYLQPNYFFNTSIEYDRLTEACKSIIAKDMDMEIEFDGNALAGNGPNSNQGYRLRNYMKACKESGIWSTRHLAYYQGAWAVLWLGQSSNEENKQLYYDFCEFVSTRPTREDL